MPVPAVPSQASDSREPSRTRVRPPRSLPSRALRCCCSSWLRACGMAAGAAVMESVVSRMSRCREARSSPATCSACAASDMVSARACSAGGSRWERISRMTCWRLPGGSPRRPGSGWAGSPRTGEPAGQPARHGRPADRQGPPGQARRVRLQAQVVDNDDGVVPGHTMEQGNPADAPQLAPAVQRVITRTRRRPRTVTADRGYGEKSVEDDLHDLGVLTVVIPRKGKPGKARQAAEHRPAFRRTVEWRTGSEARISTPKRGYGWDRTRLDGTEGARTWTGHGSLAHNLVKIGALTS